MKVRVDKELNIVRILLANTPIDDSVETEDGIVIDYDANRRVVGLEFLNASEQLVNISLVRPRRTMIAKYRHRSKRHKGELVTA